MPNTNLPHPEERHAGARLEGRTAPMPKAKEGVTEMTKDLPVWRSMLFVPVTQRRFVEGAARRGADAIILDLEDSVAASEKGRARTLVPEAAGIVSRGGADVVVRIDRALRMAVGDIEAAVGPGVWSL